MPSSNIETILTVMVGITGAAVLLQAIVLLAIFMTVRKLSTLVTGQADEFRSSIVPVLHKSKDVLAATSETIAAVKGVVERLEPKLDAAATDLAAMAGAAHEQSIRLQQTVDEIAEGVRRQAVRVDSMTTTVLNRVDRVGGFLNEAVNVPIRQVTGIVAAAKAVVDTLRAPVPPRSRPKPSHPESQATRTVDEKDLFV